MFFILHKRVLITFTLLFAFSSSLLADQDVLFSTPKELKPDVRFWTRIYTEISTSEGLIHDNKHLGIIYERLSFSPGTSFKARQKIIKEKKKYYKKILLELAESRSRRFATTRHKRVKALWPKATQANEYKEGAGRLRFQLGQSDRFKEGLVRSGRWQGYIRQEFRKLNIPNQLASLPHVESSFTPNARSHAGAAGLWQFTRSTGRRFMRIDHVLDERLDPFVASRSAGLLLKDNHQITGTWPLALTAYNHGAAGMLRATKKTGGTDIAKIVREYKGRTFGFASRNFYNAFLAALDVDQHTEKYFGQVKRDKAAVFKTVKLPTYYTTQGLVNAFGLKNNIFKSLNPALQPSIWSNSKFIPKGYHLRLPRAVSITDAKIVIAKIAHDEKSSQQKPDVSYKVRRGDSLSKIASRFKVSMSQLVAANSLRSKHRIRIGQVLKLPSFARNLQKGADKISKDATFYVVKSGDRLAVIAAKAGVLELDLLSLNKLKNKNHLNVGQKLRLREDPAVLSIAANEAVFAPNKASLNVVMANKNELQEGVLRADPSNYLVFEDGFVEIQSNETLGHFADWLKLSGSTLRALNNRKKKAPLVVGKRLKLSFSLVSKEQFEKKRIGYHLAVQEAFFKRYTVIGTEKRKMAKGDSVWVLAQGKYHAPMWLLRQYNPTVNFSKVGYGATLVFPKVVRKKKI